MYKRQVKTAKVVKDTYTDEVLELMRDNCTTALDLAMIDLLASSGMRVEMCIRDRLMHLRDAMAETLEGATITSDSGSIPADEADAVSYTHLDVYKRQACLEW